MKNIVLAVASMALAAQPTILAVTVATPPPAQVSTAEAAFARQFIPVFISGYMALRRGDKAGAQRAVAAGRAAGFHKVLTSPVGGATLEVPGLRGEHTFRWLWQALEESVDPQRNFS